MTRVEISSVTNFRVSKDNKSELTSLGIIKIKKSLLGDSAFSGWVAKVAGSSDNGQDQILEEYLKASTKMIVNILENKQEDGPSLDLLHKRLNHQTLNTMVSVSLLTILLQPVRDQCLKRIRLRR